MWLLWMVVLSSSVSQALMLKPGSVSPLSRETAEARTLLKNTCENLPTLMLSARKKCDQIISGNQGVYQKEAIEFCIPTGSNVMTCLESVQGRRFDEAILNVCRQVKVSDSSSAHFGRSECLDFFAENTSVYDEKAAQFCIKHSIGVFRDALACLNIIRDREVDVKALEKECGDKGDSFYGLNPETFNQCSNRLLRNAPVRKDILCGPGAAATAPAAGLETPASGPATKK